MTPEDILTSCIDNEKMKQFMQGFAYRPPGKVARIKKVIRECKQEEKKMSLIDDFIAWKEVQEPFTPDEKYFEEKYPCGTHDFQQDIIKELFGIRKILTQLVQEYCKNVE